jgi:hypothetical protein
MARSLHTSLWLCFFISLYAINGTSQDSIIHYLFMGHTYQYESEGKKVDYRVENLDMSVYEGIWLGGDVCSEAMLEYSTVQYIDSLFDLGNPETHWALGNHDARNGNWEWYEEFSGRPTFYAYSSNGITRVVMNTNLVPTQCEEMNAQYEMILDVCDSVETGNTLILLMHHGIWYDIPGIPDPPNYAQSLLKHWNSNCSSSETGFAESIYPALVDAHERGVEIYCILGDMGSTVKAIDFTSDDGIHFLGCGLYKNEQGDKVLIFTKNLNSGTLTFQYHYLDSLLTAQ